MLLKMAEMYEAEIDNTVDNLSNIIEPVVILILSIIVGGLIVAMYLPIFDIGKVVH
jgi:type IV pilus assembly protein PilC